MAVYFRSHLYSQVQGKNTRGSFILMQDVKEEESDLDKPGKMVGFSAPPGGLKKGDDDIDDKKGEESGDLPDRLDYAHMMPIQACYFNRKIVEKSHPARQGDG